MDEYSLKLDKFLIPAISKIQKPTILELGVENGISTKKILDVCELNNGKLYSVDVNDCSKVTDNKNWKFIQSRDDNFDFINSLIPKEIDFLYIDSLHEAKHVEKLLYNYYNKIKINGYVFIDDISHLPYLRNKPRNNFYCEINNKETYEMLINVYNYNTKNFEINFSFYSSGFSILHKISDKPINHYKKIDSREFSLKNILRILWKLIKRN